MTNTNNKDNDEKLSVSETPDKSVSAETNITYNELGAKTLTVLFGFKKEIECILWTFPNGVETAIAHKKVKLDAQQFEHHGKLYNIDHSRIQNKMGKLVYNVHVNNAIGALSFVKPKVDRDAKNAHDLLQRNWLTALWSQYRLPLLVALIACLVAVIMVILFFVMLGQNQAKDTIILNLTVENTNLKNILYPPVIQVPEVAPN